MLAQIEFISPNFFLNFPNLVYTINSQYYGVEKSVVALQKYIFVPILAFILGVQNSTFGGGGRLAFWEYFQKKI